MRAFFSRQPLCQDLRKVNTSAVLNLTNATDHPPLQQTAAGALHTSHSESSIPPGADPPHTVRAEIKIHHHPHTKWTCVPWHTLPATGKKTPLTSIHRLSTPGPLNLQEDLHKPLPRGHGAHTPANPITHLLHPIKKIQPLPYSHRSSLLSTPLWHSPCSIIIQRIFPYHVSPRKAFGCSLKIPSEGDTATSLGSLFHHSHC